MKLAATILLGLVLALAGLLVVACVLNDDCRRAYPSKERLRGVEVNEVATTASLTLARRGDFDGDGVDDAIEQEYHHIEPLFRDSSSGILRVVSGRTGEELMVLYTPTPMSRARWCGDLDGDGRDEVVHTRNHGTERVRMWTYGLR